MDYLLCTGNNFSVEGLTHTSLYANVQQTQSTHILRNTREGALVRGGKSDNCFSSAKINSDIIQNWNFCLIP